MSACRERVRIQEFKRSLVAVDNVWDYPRPPAVEPCPRRVHGELGGQAGFEELRGHFGFYPGRADAAWFDDERVRAQDGDFYGGWITGDVLGPFKGTPATSRW